LRAGAYNKLISIRRKQVTRNEIGEEAVAWIEVANCWAAIEPIRGAEFVNLRKDGSGLTTRIRTPYQAGLTPAMRVHFGAEVYEIAEVLSPREAGREIEILATKDAG
jgi:SPP1 family predicted phage head-tail adaptor